MKTASCDRPLNRTSFHPSQNQTMAGRGIRGIRAGQWTRLWDRCHPPSYTLTLPLTVASESWDDDFLWQHSSCDDLHLKTASHGLSSSNTKSNRPLGARTSTKTSSRSSYSVSSESNNAAAAGQSTETSIRPNKGSSSSTASSYTGTQSSSWGYPSQLSLNDSSPELELGRRDRMLSFTSGHLQFNNEEADEDEEEDPTITLTHARLYGAHAHAHSSSSSPSKNKEKRASIPIPSASHSLGSTTAFTSSSLLYAPLTATGLSPPSSSALFPSLSSWRSPTPSLTLSDRGQFTSGSMMLETEGDDDDDGGAVTETDNETEMDFDTGTGSRDGHSSAAAVASGSTPRYATFAAALYGSSGSATAASGIEYEGKASPLMPSTTKT